MFCSPPRRPAMFQVQPLRSPVGSPSSELNGGSPMIWYPLKISTPLRQHVFGGRLIQEKVGKRTLPDEKVAETWEISDVDGDISVVTNGEFAGKSLRDVVQQYPDEMVASGWRGPRFPLLTKFIDGSGMLPVHVHADDATAQAKYGEPNGKTEAW